MQHQSAIRAMRLHIARERHDLDRWITARYGRQFLIENVLVEIAGSLHVCDMNFKPTYWIIEG
jgi:hypothetical protein